MTNLQVYIFEQLPVRTLTIDNEPYFVGKDVANILGYKNGSRDVNVHVDDEDKLKYRISTAGQMREQTIINESGLYSLIFSSRLSSAKRFKRWVTTDVLPSIRKHGIYATDEVIEQTLNNPDYLIELLTNYKYEKEQRQQAQEEIERNRPKVLFADAVATSKSSILVGELAKIIKQNGVDIGQHRLFKWLRDNGYLIKRKGTDYNMPTQKSMNMKLFEIKETSITHSDGHVSVNKTPKVTGQGQNYFINKFLGGTITC